MLINPALLPIAKVLALPLITALVVGSCTAKHFRVKINNMELEWQAQVDAAKLRATEQVVAQQRKTQEAANEYQDRIAKLNANYLAAAKRLQNAAAARPTNTVSLASPRVDAAASGDRLPDRDGKAIAEPIASLIVPLEGTVKLLQQCDTNTQRLIGLQTWVRLQTQLDDKKDE